MSDVTQILSEIENGTPIATERLLQLVYDELRTLAAAKLAHEKPGQTLQATALVHEAYIRLMGSENVAGWDSRGHFFAAAAEAMRRILIERARCRATIKHGGKLQRVEFDEQPTFEDERADELIALDAALSELEMHDPQAAQLVSLRYFAGLSHQQAADALQISRRAADRVWALAKAWLYQHISGEFSE